MMIKYLHNAVFFHIAIDVPDIVYLGSIMKLGHPTSNSSDFAVQIKQLF